MSTRQESGRGRGRRGKGSRKRPKAVPLAEDLDAEGKRNEALERLIHAHDTDNEPSPLEDDPPDRSRVVRERKRL